MLDKNSLLKIFSKILKTKKKLSFDSAINEIVEWDSMAHLTILFEIDKITKGKASKIKDLSKCKKISDFYEKLVKANLCK